MQKDMVLTDAHVAKTVAKLIAGAVLVLDTLPAHAAHLEVVGVAVVAGLALTERLPIYHLAACIVATHGRGTRVYAFQYSLFRLLARLVALARTVISTGVWLDAARCHVRVTHSVGGTGTLVGAQEVDARGRRVARVLLTFVNVDTAAHAGQETFVTHAFLRDADFMEATVGVAATAWYTGAFNAHLSWQAVAVSKANFFAYFSSAAFTLSTLYGLLADGVALSIFTDHVGATFVVGGTGGGHADAALLGSGYCLEARRTLAHRTLVLDLTLSVRPTHIFLGARVGTLVVNAPLFGGTVTVAAAAQQTHSDSASLPSRAL